MSIKTVHNARILAALPSLHSALMDIVGVINQPERDTVLLRNAGLSLERALFPLLVIVERRGPIGIVDLADRVGRDHSTVSRQIKRLEKLGLVERAPASKDQRLREMVVTVQGKAATQALDVARGEMAVKLFRNWTQSDFDDLVRLLNALADDMSGMPA